MPNHSPKLLEPLVYQWGSYGVFAYNKGPSAIHEKCHVSGFMQHFMGFHASCGFPKSSPAV